MENWKPMLKFEGLYEVSDLGNVRRVARGKRFSSDQIESAKSMLNSGAKLKDVALFLDTSITTVMSIKHGKTWSGDPSYRPVKTTPRTDHYLRVLACKEGKYTHIAVHRAVWEAFNGAIPEGLEINHKNLKRDDNRLENLEIVTHAENAKHFIEKYKTQCLFRAVKGVKGFISGKHSIYT